MKPRRSFVKDLADSFGSKITLRQRGEGQELSFWREEKSIVVVVPDSEEVRELFIDVFVGEQKVFSDWLGIYPLHEETEQKLEADFREELSQHLNSLVNKRFRIETEGRLLKSRKLVFSE